MSTSLIAQTQAQSPLILYAGAALIMGAVILGLWFAVGQKLFSKIEAKTSADLASASSVKGNKPEDPNLKEQLRGLDKARGQFAEATTERLEGFRIGKKLSRKLERANSKLRPGEYIMVAIAIGAVVGLFTWAFRGGITAILAVGAIFVYAKVHLNRMIKKRQAAFGDQLPDLLQMMATNLRAGQSLGQAINSVAMEARSPMKEELMRVVIEQRIGRDLTASFRDLSDRMESQDFEWVVAAIDINRTVGGDLAQILGRVESTIRARNKIRGQVSAMSAEGKLSGGVLIALPPGLVLIVNVINPGYLDPMFDTTIGKGMLAGCVLMLSVGAFWLKSISEFEY